MYALDRQSIFSIADDTSLETIQFISFDVETTGLSPDYCQLVELSAVKFDLVGDQVCSFSMLIQPGCPIPPMVTNIHGINDAMVADAPTIAEVMPEFLKWINSNSHSHVRAQSQAKSSLNSDFNPSPSPNPSPGLSPRSNANPGYNGSNRPAVLVAHNAPFDCGFLKAAITRLQLAMPDNFVLDTLPLARKLLPGSDNHKLQTLVEYLRLDAGDFHRALADSHHVRNILRHLIKRAKLQEWHELHAYNCLFPFAAPRQRNNWNPRQAPRRAKLS